MTAMGYPSSFAVYVATLLTSDALTVIDVPVLLRLNGGTILSLRSTEIEKAESDGYTDLAMRLRELLDEEVSRIEREGQGYRRG